MRILCLTDFPIHPDRRWLWDFVPGNTDDLTFLSTKTSDKYRKWGKLFTKYPPYLVLAWQALVITRKEEFDLVVAWESDTGIPFALLKRVFKSSPPLAVLTFSVRGPLAHFLPVLRFAIKAIDFITVPTKHEIDYYSQILSIPRERFTHCTYGTYDVFQSLEMNTDDKFIFSGGRSERDYETLFKAIDDLGIPLVVNARPFNLKNLKIPDGVKVNDIQPFIQFRDLNLNAKFVVVPVEDVKQAAGITSVIYAMAAGKAVIATDVPGLHDYLDEGVTGLFVPPKDPIKLRETILYLWENPDVALQMGENSRKAYLDNFTFDAFAKRAVSVIENYELVEKQPKPRKKVS